MSTRIDVEFRPADHIGEWGWLWEEDAEGEGDWFVCHVTLDDDQAITRVWQSLDPPLFLDLNEAAAARLRFLPMLKPTAEPGAGVEVKMILPGGAVISGVTVEPGARADETIAAVTAAIVPRA